MNTVSVDMLMNASTGDITFDEAIISLLGMPPPLAEVPDALGKLTAPVVECDEGPCPTCGGDEDNIDWWADLKYWNCCFVPCKGTKYHAHIVPLENACDHFGCEHCRECCPGHTSDPIEFPLYSTKCTCDCEFCENVKGDHENDYVHCEVVEDGCQCGVVLETITPDKPPPYDNPAFPMWQRRGVNVEKVGKSKRLPFGSWRAIDPVQMMADFYLYSAIMDTPVSNADILHVTTLAREWRESIVTELDPLFRLYLDIAIGGELRHHPSIKKTTHIMSDNRSRAWREWLVIRDQLGVEGLRDAATMFRDKTMVSGYGGERWAIAADILYSRLTDAIPAWVFVDRVFAMQHNGGSVLNKVKWAAKTKISENHGVDGCMMIGDAHDATPISWWILLFAASTRAQMLFSRWWRLTKPDVPLPHWIRQTRRYYSSQTLDIPVPPGIVRHFANIEAPTRVICDSRLMNTTYCHLPVDHTGPHTDFKEIWE